MSSICILHSRKGNSATHRCTNTVGLLLVKSKNKMMVEYSLAGYNNPIGVANWERDITRILPAEFQGILPTIEEIESGVKDKSHD